MLRALRARNNGAADDHPPVAWRFAPHNQRIKPTPGGKAYGSPALRGLSAAPLGINGYITGVSPRPEARLCQR
ncbi:MAG: hypothetical protein F9K25_18025 [Candidatus Contendobacter sp.]|nr:MAG: hypothetical protein F9K25_18025 [Candidatus Contendobacter sp.]